MSSNADVSGNTRGPPKNFTQPEKGIVWSLIEAQAQSLFEDDNNFQHLVHDVCTKCPRWTGHERVLEDKLRKRYKKKFYGKLMRQLKSQEQPLTEQQRKARKWQTYYNKHKSEVLARKRQKRQGSLPAPLLPDEFFPCMPDEDILMPLDDSQNDDEILACVWAEPVPGPPS